MLESLKLEMIREYWRDNFKLNPIKHSYPSKSSLHITWRKKNHPTITNLGDNYKFVVYQLSKSICLRCKIEFVEETKFVKYQKRRKKKKKKIEIWETQHVVVLW